MPDHVDRIVQAWRRERSDLDLAALVLLGRLFRTAHLADAALAKPLAAHGLQPGRFDLLAALRRAGEPYALKPTQLMQTMLLSSGGGPSGLTVSPTPAWSNAAQIPTTAEVPSFG